ncbi:MAG: YdcF family protein [Betaproteobacteria bacterium]|nr:YdcF family protein [Betaproteobacteria bacterium]
MNAYAMSLLGSFLLPPKVLLIPAIAAWFAQRRWPRAARALLGAMLMLLWIFAMPATGDALLESLDRASYPAVAAPLEGAQAIVLLSGGRHYGAREFGGDTADASSLERVRHAALLARKTGLPVLVAGGKPEKNDVALADLVAQALAEYGVAAAWREGESKNTAENALYTARLLHPLGIRRVVLVTHGTHMTRAQEAFRRAGFEVLPQAVGLHHEQPLFPTNFLPSGQGMVKSEMYFHELLGLLWYRLTQAGKPRT